MSNYVEISISNYVYKLDERYADIAQKWDFSKEELETLRQANPESNDWRDKSFGVIESLDGKFVLCSSSELDGIDLVFERKRNESGDEIYCLTESNKKVIFG